MSVHENRGVQQERQVKYGEGDALDGSDEDPPPTGHPMPAQQPAAGNGAGVLVAIGDLRRLGTTARPPRRRNSSASYRRSAEGTILERS